MLTCIRFAASCCNIKRIVIIRCIHFKFAVLKYISIIRGRCVTTNKNHVVRTATSASGVGYSLVIKCCYIMFAVTHRYSIFRSEPAGKVKLDWRVITNVRPDRETPDGTNFKTEPPGMFAGMVSAGKHYWTTPVCRHDLRACVARKMWRDQADTSRGVTLSKEQCVQHTC